MVAGVRKIPDPMVMPMTRPMEDQSPRRRTSCPSVPAAGGACLAVPRRCSGRPWACRRAEAGGEGGTRGISGQ